MWDRFDSAEVFCVWIRVLESKKSSLDIIRLTCLLKYDKIKAIRVTHVALDMHELVALSVQRRVSILKCKECQCLCSGVKLFECSRR